MMDSGTLGLLFFPTSILFFLIALAIFEVAFVVVDWLSRKFWNLPIPGSVETEEE